MAEGADKLARGRIPEACGATFICREDPSAVRTKRPVPLTAISGSAKEAMSLPEAASQSLAVLSKLAVRIRVPSGLNAAWLTAC